MKKLIGFIIIVSITTLSGYGAFKLPNSVYRMNELEKAKLEAKTKGKPITIVYTDESSSCGLCAGASLKVADELKSKSVVIYVNAHTEAAMLPAKVLGVLRSPEAGQFIPKTVVMDANLENVVAIVPYGHSAELDASLKNAKKAISKLNPGSNVPVQSAAPGILPQMPQPAIPEQREMRTWQSQSGSTLNAAFVQDLDATIILEKADGTRVRIGKADLIQGDQDYIAAKKLKAQQLIGADGKTVVAQP